MKRSWTPDNLLPAGTGLTLGSIVTKEKGLIIDAAGPGRRGLRAVTRRRAPVTAGPWRTLRDVAAHGQFVTLRVRVSRWRCRNPPCETDIFADRKAVQPLITSHFVQLRSTALCPLRIAQSPYLPAP